VLIIVNVTVFVLMFLSDIGIIQDRFIAGMVIALGFGLGLKKKREKLYRL
jgi:energy-converting hydrogenase Eha subunit B